MPIELIGDFVIIQRTTLRVSEIISCKPVLIVQYDHNGQEIGRDFPKIIVITNQGTQQFLYLEEDIRDADLRDLQEKISSYSVSNSNKRNSSENTTINISSSSGVSVVSNSQNVTISQDQQERASEIIQKLQSEVIKYLDLSQEIREDIFAALNDFQTLLTEGKAIKRYSFKNLLGLTADLAALNGFAIQLGQVLGFISN